MSNRPMVPVEPALPSTFAEALAPSAVDMATLHRRHGPLLELVRRIIGVVPNCDAYLEIWPTAFRTYNLMVPNFLNLPFVLLGSGVDKAMLGMAMYASSRAASCMYCSAHTCSFALRRGAPAETVGRIATGDRDGFDARERAVIDVAEGLSFVPATLGTEHRAALRRHFSDADVEWLVLGVAMMGFLNKMMDALGVELEQASVDEVGAVIEGSGWTAGKHRVVPTAPELTLAARPDGWLGALALAPSLPGALSRERRWTKGVPSGAAQARAWLEREVGCDLPMLAQLKHARAVRALVTMLRDNLAPGDTQIGLAAKHLAAIVFGRVVADEAIVALGRALAARASIDESAIEAVDRFGRMEIDEAELPLDDRERALVAAARAASSSPALIEPALLARTVGALGPEGTIELLTWLSILQLLHRLAVFYA